MNFNKENKQTNKIWKDAVDDSGAEPLEMANVVGIFYVLLMGSGFSFFFGITGLMLESYKNALKHKVCGVNLSTCQHCFCSKHSHNSQTFLCISIQLHSIAFSIYLKLVPNNGFTEHSLDPTVVFRLNSLLNS